MGILRQWATGPTGRGVQGHGAQPACGGHRSNSRCGLQSHRRRKSSRAHAVFPRNRQSCLLLAESQEPRFYLDFTGTGNTFNLVHPRSLQLVTDSLRYWVLEMHVDGFRFDLASALARDHSGFNTLHPFFQVIQQDPVLSQVKLIAEPWDIGEGGYQVGIFRCSGRNGMVSYR